MSEAEVVMAFVRWLEADGWTARTEVAFADVVAERGQKTLVAEAKGVTASAGLDIDTLYGQLLRRMADVPGHAQFAVVVPEQVVSMAVRVPAHVRQLLRIVVYGVDPDGTVRRH